MPAPESHPPVRPARRKRYRGTHPRSFEEKHKELDPERHPGEAAKVRARGQTPAGTHVPVLLEAVLEALRPAPGHVVLDGTLGHGGHAEAIAERVAPGGRVIGLDRDAEAIARTERRLREKGLAVTARRGNFAGAGKVLAEEGIDGFDGLLADLGASSVQLDDPSRGFSFKREGPLDMRMDRSRGLTAEEWLRRASEPEIADALERWGEESEAERVAAAIAALVARSPGPLTTLDLAAAVLRAKGLPQGFRASSPFDQHPAARAFQAIRIALNREEESLKTLLRALPYVLRPGARAAILTFHGGDDRLVAAAFEEGLAAGLYCATSDEPVRPRADEVRSNPRARSARLRWVER
ncbi:MAG: 16S rRNA (cytosine(1402)-N(4))-methyltransferase RsmH [Planctomycetes bacterium]|nr:16S rRNA (cytosine(1402)-N(4))-methyltransferase RsmH [Planctomycetota bacterium]